MMLPGVGKQCSRQLGKRALVVDLSSHPARVRASQPGRAPRAVPSQVQEVATGTWHVLSEPAVWQVSDADSDRVSASQSWFSDVHNVHILL